MSQLFDHESIQRPSAARDNRTAAMHALARLKQFRAGRIDLPKAEINRDLDIVFSFVEQVTA